MNPTLFFLFAFLSGFFVVPYAIWSVAFCFPFSVVLRLKKSAYSLLFLFFGLGGLVAIHASQERLDLFHLWRGELVKVSGVVENPFLPRKYPSIWKPGTLLESSSCQFRIHTVYQEDKRPLVVDQRVILQLDDFCFFWRGQQLEVIGQMYHIRNKLHLKVRQKEGILFKENPNFLLQNMLRYQERFLFFLEKHFSEDQNALFRMLLFGERRSEPFLLHFYRAGVAHFLAISGLHLFCFFSFLAWFLNRLHGYSKKMKMGLGLLLLGGLFFLVQFTPSMTRTSGVFLLYFLGIIFKRNIDPISLSIFLFFILISFQPILIDQPGFQLTFSAFAGIFILYPPLNALVFKENMEVFTALPRWKKLMFLYAKSVLFSFALQIATFPILWYHFQQYHLLSSFFTPFLLFPFQLLLFGLLGLAFGGFLLPEFILVPYTKGLSFFCEMFLKLIYGMSHIPGNHQSIWERPWWLYFLYLIPLFFLIQKKIRALFLSLGGFFLLFNFFVIAPPLATFVDIGQGNATILQKNGKVLLYDVGSLNPNVLQKLVQFCWKRGITKIDQCILSHADADHYNLLQPLSQWIFIEEIALTPKTFSALSWYLKPILSKGTTLRFLQKGDSFDGGPGFSYSVLSPDYSEMEQMSDNNASLVLQVKIGPKTLGLTGDIEQLQIERLNIATEITLFPHHGSTKNNLTSWKNRGSHVIVSCDYWFKHHYYPKYCYTYLQGHICFRENKATPEFQFAKEDFF